MPTVDSVFNEIEQSVFSSTVVKPGQVMQAVGSMPDYQSPIGQSAGNALWNLFPPTMNGNDTKRDTGNAVMAANGSLPNGTMQGKNDLSFWLNILLWILLGILLTLGIASTLWGSTTTNQKTTILEGLTA